MFGGVVGLVMGISWEVTCVLHILEQKKCAENWQPLKPNIAN